MEDLRSFDSVTDLRPGDHLCCLYEKPQEHQALVTPFLRSGLERREKVICIVDAHTAQVILGYLRSDGVDVQPYMSRGQLSILPADDVYLRNEVFDPAEMIALLQRETDAALDEGYTALRVTGEMTWALRGLPGSERLIEYESRLNEFFPGKECLALCQYDRFRFDPEILLDVLATHPIVAIGTELYENSFYYIPPAEYPLSSLPARKLYHQIRNLAERRALAKEKDQLLQSLQQRLNDLTSQLEK